MRFIVSYKHLNILADETEVTIISHLHNNLFIFFAQLEFNVKMSAVIISK